MFGSQTEHLDEVKRKRNLKYHGFDFVDAERVFEGATFTYEDDRFRYSEQRFVTLGLLQGIPVSLPHRNKGSHPRYLLPKGNKA